MDKFGKRFKEQRKLKGLTQEQLANMFNLRKSSISRYENNQQMPEMQLLKGFANFFGVSTDYLLGNDNADKKTDGKNSSNLIEIDKDEMVKIPVLGVIKAGIPIFAEENIIDYEYIHREELQVGGNYFYLHVKGDSMIDVSIKDGSRVLIKRQNFIENNGDIMAVRVNGEEATLKRVYKQDNGVVLKSENPNYAPMFYPASDIEIGYVSLVGKAIEVKIKL